MDPYLHDYCGSKAGLWGVPIPLLMDGFLVQPRIYVDQPADVMRVQSNAL
ncbi:UNVERIFIED_ORG: hypothetical protein J2740_005249 [Rhizobium nepotum]|nr:hypothetical protein [Rhizobium nepotum]